MRIATWNVNSVGARLPRLLPWLEEVQPDVVALQETKTATFPEAEVRELGYATAHNGDGRWNGCALLSRVGLEDVALAFPGQPGYAGEDDGALLPREPVVEARAVGATCGGLRVWSLYVPNGRSVGHPHFDYKLAWLTALREALASEVTAGPLAVLGDFNVALTDDDVWDPSLFVGSTHVTDEERAAVRAVLDLGLTDHLPRISKGRPFTFFDYRAGQFHKGNGMRIDLTLTGPGITVQDCWIDREARKGTGPSDHAPVVVDLEL